MEQITRKLHFWNMFFRIRFFNRKNVLLVILLFLLITIYLNPIRDFALLSNYPKISLWVYPFLLTDMQFLLLFVAGTIYFFSDFPFMDGWNKYYLHRVGRIKWLIIQIKYIVASAILIVSLVLIFIAISLWPYTDISEGWGKVIYTMAKTDAGQQTGMFWKISLQFLNQNSPLKAMVISIFISVIGIIFVGIIMMVCHLCISRSFGVLFLTGMTVFVPVADYFGELFQIELSMLSPISWMRISNLGIIKYGNYIAPSCTYVICMYLGIIGLISIFLVKKIQKIDFFV